MSITTAIVTNPTTFLFFAHTVEEEIILRSFSIFVRGPYRIFFLTVLFLAVLGPPARSCVMLSACLSGDCQLEIEP
jgi:hypothetical protein